MIDAYGVPVEVGGQRPDDVNALSLRVSDDERHAVAEVLREAAGVGRLDLQELDERLDAVYAAKTYADLRTLTADLPSPGQLAVPSTVPAVRPASEVAQRARTSSYAVMSETKRTGVWRVSEEHTAWALMGEVVIDLRQAQIPGPEVTITAVSVMGGIVVLVDAAVRTHVDGYALMGSFGERPAHRKQVPAVPAADAPLVRVRGVALMGSVEVKRS